MSKPEDLEFDLGIIYEAGGREISILGARFDEDDLLLITMLADPIYGTELLWDDPQNQDYGECYRVRDYQWPMFRTSANSEIYACARSTGKTESVKAKAFTHTFRRHGQNLLLTAPQLIHLLPLVDAIEDRLTSVRFSRDFLDTRNGSTGLTHRPFGAKFIDGTQIIGRIPGLNGVGVKGQHQPDLIIDEGQDYNDKAYTEVMETVMQDGRDWKGDPDYTFTIYGVHSGNRAGQFHRLSNDGEFKLGRITAIMRPDWTPEMKRKVAAYHGGTTSSDYRRNILGEAGAPTSAFFEQGRLMACVDQGDGNDPNSSEYNAQEYQAISWSQRQLEELGVVHVADVIDLPLNNRYKKIWAGMDLGLTDSPTVISIFSEEVIDGRNRIKLIRRITLKECTTPTIRAACYHVATTYGARLKGFGMDITGLGFPIWQEMQADEVAPPQLMRVSRGFKFNAKVPVAVEQGEIIEAQGRQMDRLGNAISEEMDPMTGNTIYVTYMPMIEASTRYIREWVDSRTLMLPFDREVISDMMGETQGRVRGVGKLSGASKPNAFHILDSFRAMSMCYSGSAVEEALNPIEIEDVIDIAW